MSGATNGGRSRGYEALRESEELHRATLGSISDAVFLANDEGAFTYICPNVDVIFGFVPDEVQAMGRIGRFLGEDLFDPAELTARGEIRNVEREITSKSGEARIVLIHLKRVSIKGATVLCTCRDITELRHAEKELAATRVDLAHAARLALVGELTASIVHELRQPLMAISANASAGVRLLREPAKVGEAVDSLSDICSEAETAAQILERLRMMVRKRPLESVALDLNEIARSVQQIVTTDARRRGVTLNVELLPALPAIKGDRVSLQQVVLNLILNAIDAADQNDRKEKRTVTVRTGCCDGTVEVTVHDTGKGIPPDHLPRIFDAFFTTKPDGIGLGLSIARTIVEAHAGRIRVENPGNGATFRVELPARA